ncbi:crossover junction endodeoxyribonuclease RuvC [Siphonobacter sp. BAB-5405]|nr:crossover junction endodeoxyribonuclease RuvC [Siphonobacter sp. BAB-5405]PMD94887.1 crossover junction endodeoxyribonuclease RuvC [Siphonobacter sp. BAB-5405]
MAEKIILGVDPGTRYMGYGLILVEKGNITLLQYGVINLTKYDNHELKLGKIFERITGIIDEFSPDEMALEAPFFGKNVQSMLKLGRAQGVAMAAALARQIPIVEYSPKTVKQSVTGNGNASKEQVSYMLESILKMKLEGERLDATDALGVAICHYYHENTLASNKGKKALGIKQAKKGSWAAFLSENQDRIKG